MCWTSFIIIVSLFGLVCSFCSKNLSKCENVLIEKLDGKLNNQQIQVISHCPANYSNTEIKRKCEYVTPEGAIAEDIFLFTLVRGKCPYPYYNIYCAMCWNEATYHNFPPHLNLTYRHENGGNEFNPKPEEPPLVFRNLTLNRTSNEWISNDGRTKYDFKVVRSLKVHNYSKNDAFLQHGFHDSHIKSCNSSSLNHDDSACQNISSMDKNCNSKDTETKNLIDLFEEIWYLRVEEKWTPNQTFFPKESLPKLKFCKFANSEGNPCSYNGYLVKGVDFTFGEHGDIFLMENETKFDRRQYTNDTYIENVIYLCQPKIPSTDHYCIQIMNTITAWSRRLSLFFVVLYLVINCNREYLSNLADKFTFSYYLTLLAMYIREEISEWQSEEEAGCFLKYYALKYLSQSYSIWICICTFYVWYIIRFSKEQICDESKNTERQLVKYLIMCFLGWILPAIFSLVFYFFEPTPSCPVIQGYTSLKLCQREDNKCPYYWFTLTIIIISSVTVVILFFNACYCYYFAKSIYSRYCKFEKLRARMVFLFKIVYSIGLYSMLAMYSILGLSGGINAILTHLWSIHGTVIFFVYSFKMTVLKQLFKDKEEVCENCSCKGPVKRKNNFIRAQVSAVKGNCVENE